MTAFAPEKDRQIVLIRYTSGMTISGKEVDLKDLLKSMAKGNRKLWIFAGQPRMRLWIERRYPVRQGYQKHRSASYEAVNWKVKYPCLYQNACRSASYEAVNWKDLARIYNRNSQRSASYEAVNWKIKAVSSIIAFMGQPRMRLWIERLLQKTT